MWNVSSIITGCLLAGGVPSEGKRRHFIFPVCQVTFAAHNTHLTSFERRMGSCGEARWSDGNEGVKFYQDIAMFTLHLLLEAAQELLATQTHRRIPLWPLKLAAGFCESSWAVDFLTLSLQSLTVVSIFSLPPWDYIWFGEWKMTQSHYK